MRESAAAVAFVTGAARGIGRAIATRLARDGMDVVVTDTSHRRVPGAAYDLSDESDLELTAEEARASGCRCLAIEADVRDQAALDRAVDEALARFGRLDVVCANAGVGGFGKAWELSEEEWSTVVDINLSGVWRTAKAAAPTLIERGAGCIVVTASINGRDGLAGASHYVAAKHGVLGLAKTLALELGPHGIRVNSVLPGLVHTRMGDNPSNRKRLTGGEDGGTAAYLAAARNAQLLAGRTALSPVAVANAVAWLASDDACEVTGLELVVDAGHSLLPGFNAASAGDA